MFGVRSRRGKGAVYISAASDGRIGGLEVRGMGGLDVCCWARLGGSSLSWEGCLLRKLRMFRARIIID